MDSALVIITLASLGTTGAVLLYAARLIRDERSRSNARVTALAQEIGHLPAGPDRAAAPHAYAAPAADIPIGRAQREPIREHVPVPAARTPVRRAPEPRRAGGGRDEPAEAAPVRARVTRTTDDGALRAHGAGRAALFQSASTEPACQSHAGPDHRCGHRGAGAGDDLLRQWTARCNGRPCARGGRRAECSAGARVAAAGP